MPSSKPQSTNDLKLNKVSDTAVLNNTIELSVLVPVVERLDSVGSTFLDYYEKLGKSGISFEFIYVVSTDFTDAVSELRALKEDKPDFLLVLLPKSFGEATAINVGFEHANGQYILTLPSYPQVESIELVKLIASRSSADLITAKRFPRHDSRLNRIQTHLFSRLVSSISGLRMEDAGCGVRIFDRTVLEKVNLYGDFHRFLPVLARQQGFRVIEVPLKQAKADQHRRVYSPGIYLRRSLDLVALYFLVRFTSKPFRFFGLIGSSLFLTGAMITLWVLGDRIFMDVALADRPVFLLSTMLMVFGLQILSTGLIGEIIIFSRNRKEKEYSIRRIIE